MKGWLVAARLLYLPGALGLYAVGVLLTRGQGANWLVAAAGVAVVLVHLVTHFVNDAEDVATDDQTANPTLMSGGSRAIQRGLVTAAQLSNAAIAMSVTIGLIAVAAVAAGARSTGALLVVLWALGYFYSGRPIALGRHLLGELAAAIDMGLVLPLLGAEAAGGATSSVYSIAAIFVVATFIGRLATAFPDIEPDRATRKWTVTALLGPRWSAVAFALASIALIVIAHFVALDLPHSNWLVGAADWMGAVGLGIAILVGAGWAERHARWVPMIFLGAYGPALMLALGVCALR